MDYDVVIIGAGVVGLAIAERAAVPGRGVLVAEKHDAFGRETSSRSSEVIHACIYYPKDSLKARLCVRGNHLLYELAKKRSIPHRNCGKLIVAVTPEEEKKLPGILKSATETGAERLRIVEKEEMARLEPKVSALSALYCPTSGIIDSHSLMKYFHERARENGADFLFGGEVAGVERKNSGYEVSVKERDGSVSKASSRVVVNAAGLFSGEVASLAGFDKEKLNYRIYYRKGTYVRVSKKLSLMPEMLIYPVPPEDATVGIHTVPEMSGGMRLGPRDEWAERLDYSVDENLLPLFYKAVKPFLPVLEMEDLSADMSGFQAKRYGPGERSRDFVIREESSNGFPGFINLIGIESPGLTSSPAIGEMVGGLIEECLA